MHHKILRESFHKIKSRLQRQNTRKELIADIIFFTKIYRHSNRR